MKTVLLIATFDTKEQEAFFLKERIEARGVAVLTMDTGILTPPRGKVDLSREDVAGQGSFDLAALVGRGDKGDCIHHMIIGATAMTRKLYQEGRISAVVGIGGAQGTEIATAAMRELPIGVPRLMVSTVASGRATFGTFVGTKDITLMHSVADLQGLNFLTKQILNNAAGAIAGMVTAKAGFTVKPEGIPVAVSLVGTTTPGALRAKEILERSGFEALMFHQNGTGGPAMEDLIREGAFRGVLDLNLHEIADRLVGGLHSSVRNDRLEAAGELGIPQVVAPGSANYVVLGPLKTLTPKWRKRKLIVHNPSLTLVSLSPDEMSATGRIMAEKINRARGPVHLFLPLKGFCFPDREGLPLWDPGAKAPFYDSLKRTLHARIPVTEVDAHINDPEFTDLATETFIRMLTGR